MAINIATTLYNRCDILLLEHLTGNAAQVGVYAAAYRVLDGIILLASPFSWIWFRKLRMVSETKDQFVSLLLWMCLTLAGVAVLILGCGLVYGKALVAWLFGQGYLESVQILPWLLGALIFALPNGILTMGAIAQNRERGYAMAAGLGALVNIGLNIVLIPEFGARGAAWATVATEAFLISGLMICLYGALCRKETASQKDPPCQADCRYNLKSNKIKASQRSYETECHYPLLPCSRPFMPGTIDERIVSWRCSCEKASCCMIFWRFRGVPKN